MFQVYKESCHNCLLSKNRIVSGKRVKEIISGCKAKQTHFICHKASIDDKDVCCKTFYDKFGHFSQMIRIAERLNMVKFIDLPDNEKLIPYNK
jgi:hypothetical protein